MISFSTLGIRSGLGNHLFQYVFLRTTAQRLGVQFYCPEWIGDFVFELNDTLERAKSPSSIFSEYVEPRQYTGINKSAFCIQDGTNIQGYFQTEQYFNKDHVREWYRFKEDSLLNVRQKFESIDFTKSCGLSIRLGDFVTTYGDLFYVPRLEYYMRALKQVKNQDNIIVFSDDISGAKVLLNKMGERFTFIDGYKPYEGIYLQSLCHDFICSNSTYSWWGAWLNNRQDKVIVAPAEGPFRPGSPVKNHEFWPSDWQTTSALRYGLDHRNAFKTKRFFQRVLNKTQRIFNKISI
jgi:hypothetical protein